MILWKILRRIIYGLIHIFRIMRIIAYVSEENKIIQAVCLTVLIGKNKILVEVV